LFYGFTISLTQAWIAEDSNYNRVKIQKCKIKPY